MSLWTTPSKRRWIGWGLLALGFLLVSFHRVSTAVLSEDLFQAFDTTGAELGLLHASFFYIYAVMQLPAGVVVDWLGTRKVGAFGTAIMGLGAVGFGMSEVYALAFVSRALMGLGGSVLFVATLRFGTSWYRQDEFGTLSGVTVMFAGVGGVLATTPLAVAINSIGWQSTSVLIGVFSFILAIGIYVGSHSTPTLAGLPKVEGAVESQPQTLQSLRADIKAILVDTETWLLGVFLFFFLGIALTVFGLWVIPYLVQVYDLSVTTASFYLLVATLGGLFGGPLMGWLSDTLGRRREILLVGSVLLMLAYGVIALFGAPPLLLVGGLLLFIRVLLGLVALTFTLVKERHPEASGTAIGVINGLGFGGAAVFPAVMGASLDAFWTGQVVDGTRVYTVFGYRVAFAIATASTLLGVCCIAWIYLREQRNRRCQRNRGRRGLRDR